METFFRGLLERVREFLGGMERGQRIRLFALSGVLLVVVIAAIVLLTRTDYDVLYSNMKADEAGMVMTRLKELGVDAKTQNGDTILVPKNSADTLRWQLASEGMLVRDVDYDIFAQGSAFGATNVEKQFYETAYTEEKIRKNILLYDKIEDAEVDITPQSESNFVLSQNVSPASAAVYIKVKDGERLTDKEATTIAYLVVPAVRGLTLENVKIADTQMRIYDNFFGPDTEEEALDQMNMRESFEKRLQDRVLEFLAPAFGKENLSAKVNLVLNFDKEIVQSTILSAPVEGSDEGFIISYKELSETIRGYESSQGVVGTDNNGFDSYPTEDNGGTDVYSKVSTEMNRDVNEIKTQLEKAQGTIIDMSVGVLINANYGEADYTANVRTLLSNALGVDERYISVDRLPFMQASSEVEDVINLRKSMEDARNFSSLLNAIIIGGAILVAAILILLIVRSFAPPKPVPVQTATMIDAATGMELDVVVGEEEEDFVPSEPTNLERIADFVKSDPESVASLLRNWLQD